MEKSRILHQSFLNKNKNREILDFFIYKLGLKPSKTTLSQISNAL